jgi:hypothetical protein
MKKNKKKFYSWLERRWKKVLRKTNKKTLKLTLNGIEKYINLY